MAQCIVFAETTLKALDAGAFGCWFPILPFKGSWHIQHHQLRQLNLFVRELIQEDLFMSTMVQAHFFIFSD